MIVIAGATGNLGGRIVKALRNKNAEVRVLVRSNSQQEKVNALEESGAQVSRINNWNVEELAAACTGASCVVSVLAGLRDVIFDAQKTLLDAAVVAKVPRFIPSDYSLDFTKFSNGENRNLDLRREFHQYLDTTSISATSVFNGAFADMLTDQMPVILFKKKWILYWGNADYQWGFTTMDDTAEYTANVALDAQTPRYLRIAGDQISPREMREVASEVTGKKFHLFRAGGKILLGLIIKIARSVAPGENELYPAWQGMQYMQNMTDERSRIKKIDNYRYPAIDWTSVKELLVDFKAKGGLENK